MTLITIVLYWLILAVLVIWHELGHFSVAKFFKIRVDEFGIGFPPRICQLFRWRGTDFTLNLIPMGGFVNLAGESAPSNEEQDSQSTPVDTQGQALFYQKKAWQRFLVILAGPVMNIFLALAIFVLVYSLEGVPERFPGQTFIDFVEPDSPAQMANLPVNGRLLALQDATGAAVEVTDIDAALDFLRGRHGQTVTLTLNPDCKRGVCTDQIATYAATLRTDEQIPAGGGALGVSFTDYQFVFYPWYRHIPLSLYYGCRESFYMIKQLLLAIWQVIIDLFQPGPNEAVLMGPVGIVSELNRSRLFQQGLVTILSFAGMLSLNLGVVNLLPIPAVDGGRLFLIMGEKIVGKTRINKIEGWLNYVGVILIIGLTILITGADIWRLFGKN